MILTGEGARQRAVERLEAADEKKRQADEKAKEQQNKQDRKRRTRETDKVDSKTKRRKPTQKDIVHIRKESKTSAAAGVHDKCATENCDSKWSVFEKYAARHSLAFRQCGTCQQWFCCFCIDSEATLGSVHVPMCKQLKAALVNAQNQDKFIRQNVQRQAEQQPGV